MQVADHNDDKNLCKSIEDFLFMQFRREGTKVFIAGTKENTYLCFAVFIHSAFVN